MDFDKNGFTYDSHRDYMIKNNDYNYQDALNTSIIQWAERFENVNGL